MLPPEPARVTSGACTCYLEESANTHTIKVTPNRFASKDEIPFSGWARCKDVVRELYQGLLECAKAFPKDYVDGCPFTYDVVYNEMKSEKIENYLKPVS